MTKISVYYVEEQGLDEIELVPMKMIVRFPRGKVDWNKCTVYIPVQAPFTRHFSEDYIEDVMSVTIAFEDLLLNHERPKHFGISLDYLVRRLMKMKQRENLVFDLMDIEQFIIQIDDLEELLRMDVRPFYEWRS